MKSPNWTSLELELALELYLSKDMQWHSKISNETFEIVALSELLNGLDIVAGVKPANFRSPSSIRLKLANFKSLDERYGNSAMSNVGSMDKSIWSNYSKNYDLLHKHCISIVREHYKGTPSKLLKEYLQKYISKRSASCQLDEYANELLNIALKMRQKAVLSEDLDFSQQVIDECYQIIKGIQDLKEADENQKDICTEKFIFDEKSISEDDFKHLLEAIKKLDEKKVFITKGDLVDVIKTNVNLDTVIDKLKQVKILAPFQHSTREMIVEDYDLLYKMISNPKRYIKGNR